MSTANSSTIVGMSSSPPATPIRAATMPMPTPAASPSRVRGRGCRSSRLRSPKWFHASAAAISTSSTARTPVEGGRAHSGSPGGPNPGADEAAGEQVDHHEPAAVHRVKGDGHRAGRAVTTTIKLSALFMITACRAAKPNKPMSNGSRNSAPPRPTRPSRSPTPAPVARAAHSDLALAGAAAAPVDGPITATR